MQYFTIIFSIMMIIYGGMGVTGDFPVSGIISLIAGLGIGAGSIWSLRKQKTPKLALEGMDEERAQLLRENYAKAVTDFRYLQSVQGKLNDKEINSHLSRLQRVAKNLIMNLEKHPERIPTAYKFIDYYQDRAVKIVQQYQDLEETELSTEKVQDLKNRMKSALVSLEDAYAEQFEHILNDQILSVDAELKVMEQQFDAEGIKRTTIDSDSINDDNVFIEIYNPQSKQLGRKRRPKLARPQVDLNNLSVIPEGERAHVIQRKLIQSALAIFFGTFGAHKFYQRKTFWGILYFIFCWTSIPTWIGLLEGIRYLFMPIDDFYLQYVDD